MTVKSMTEAQIARFWRVMEEQGVGVTRTKKGLFLRLPNGESTVVHFTESDVRAQSNLIARLRRAGVVHPDDPRGPNKLPTYITSPQPKKSTLERARKVIEELGYPPRVATSDLYDAFSVQDAPRMLHFLGYTPAVIRGARGMRLWDAPEELDVRFMNKEPEAPIPTPREVAKDDVDRELHAMVEAGKSEDVLTVAVENTQDATDDYEKEPYKNPGPTIAEAATPEFIEEHRTPESEIKTEDGVQFIDERDSWVVDLEEFFGESWVFVKDKFAVLDVLHMDAELRVWRTR